MKPKLRWEEDRLMCGENWMGGVCRIEDDMPAGKQWFGYSEIDNHDTAYYTTKKSAKRSIERHAQRWVDCLEWEEKE